MQRFSHITRLALALIAALTLTITTHPASAGNALEAIEGATKSPTPAAALESTTPPAPIAQAAHTGATDMETPAEEPISLRAEDGRGIMTWLAMILLGGAAFGTLVLLRRRDSNGEIARPAIEVLQTTRIGGKWQVSLVRVPGKTLVLGVTDKGLSTLSEIEDDLNMTRSSSNAMNEATHAVSDTAESALTEHDENTEVLEEILKLTRQSPGVVRESTPIAPQTAKKRPDRDRRAILERLESYRRESLGS